jgi:hypothetical protein
MPFRVYRETHGAGKLSTAIPAFTGTPLRMKVLPDPQITCLDYHKTVPQTMSLDDINGKPNVDEMYGNNGDNELYRKCVYTYEDKYTFSRILVNDSLVFDSHFESGNLHSAFRVFPIGEETSRKHYYDLYMHYDLHTSGYTQWFYFRVSNAKVGQEVTFYIKNFAKNDSLYKEGMKPLLMSTKSKNGWVRCGKNISYFPCTECGIIGGEKGLQSSLDGSEKNKKKKDGIKYVLSFTHTFEHSDDVCYFAYCQPYTYSDLQRYLLSINMDLYRSKHCRNKVLCYTLGGNKCNLLTITAPTSTAEDLNNRIIIVFTARVHPGETNSSWIMQGIIDYLTSDNEQAIELRSKYIFKIIPMLNPDGVINGNYRTSLAGVDLNRYWCKPDKFKHPTIYHVKEMISKINKRSRKIGLILDLHGHSKKQGIFLYSCIPDKSISKYSQHVLPTQTNDNQNNNASKVEDVSSISHDILADCNIEAEPTTSSKGGESFYIPFNNSNNYVPTPGKSCPLDQIVAWKVRLFPRILETISPIFSYDYCSFKMQKSKVSTMRIVCFAELGIDCTYTLEASLGGNYPYHFSAHDLVSFGNHLCVGLLAAYPAMSLKQLDSPTISTVVNSTISYLSTCCQDSTNKFHVPNNNNFLELREIISEIPLWRPYYNVSENSVGASLLSTFGLSEMVPVIYVKETTNQTDIVSVSSNNDTNTADTVSVSNSEKENISNPSKSEKPTLIAFGGKVEKRDKEIVKRKSSRKNSNSNIVIVSNDTNNNNNNNNNSNNNNIKNIPSKKLKEGGNVVKKTHSRIPMVAPTMFNDEISVEERSPRLNRIHTAPSASEKSSDIVASSKVLNSNDESLNNNLTSRKGSLLRNKFKFQRNFSNDVSPDRSVSDDVVYASNNQVSLVDLWRNNCIDNSIVDKSSMAATEAFLRRQIVKLPQPNINSSDVNTQQNLSPRPYREAYSPKKPVLPSFDNVQPTTVTTSVTADENHLSNNNIINSKSKPAGTTSGDTDNITTNSSASRFLRLLPPDIQKSLRAKSKSVLGRILKPQKVDKDKA